MFRYMRFTFTSDCTSSTQSSLLLSASKHDHQLVLKHSLTASFFITRSHQVWSSALINANTSDCFADFSILLLVLFIVFHRKWLNGNINMRVPIMNRRLAVYLDTHVHRTLSYCNTSNFKQDLQLRVLPCAAVVGTTVVCALCTQR
jgi:hypothetical protein